MASADTAWKDAQNACFEYLVGATESEVAVKAWQGDRLTNTKLNVWCFIISGGPVQDQNFQCKRPGYVYYTNGILRAQYKNMFEAMDLAGQIMNSFPVYYDTENIEGMVENGRGRGLPPNVEAFEMTNFPDLFSDIIKDESGEDVQVWILIVNFRVVFNCGKE